MFWALFWVLALTQTVKSLLTWSLIMVRGAANTEETSG